MKPLNLSSVSNVVVTEVEYFMLLLEEEIDLNKIDAPEA